MSISPKKLSIDKMWDLYKLLDSGIPKQDEKFLLHETIKIMEGISTYNFKQALKIFYGENFAKDKNPGEFAKMFVHGIKDTGFIAFAHLTRNLRGDA